MNKQTLLNVAEWNRNMAKQAYNTAKNPLFHVEAMRNYNRYIRNAVYCEGKANFL
jgi:hypothetical protein